MGSTEGAVVTGFICRLCAKVNRFVIHIFGEEGQRMQLADKIKAYLPITVTADDPLPKTVCLSCIYRLEVYHELVEHYRWAQQRLRHLLQAQKEEKEKEKRGNSSQDQDCDTAGPSDAANSSEENHMECEPPSNQATTEVDLEAE